MRILENRSWSENSNLVEANAAIDGQVIFERETAVDVDSIVDAEAALNFGVTADVIPRAPTGNERFSEGDDSPRHSSTTATAVVTSIGGSQGVKRRHASSQ